MPEAGRLGRAPVDSAERRCALQLGHRAARRALEPAAAVVRGHACLPGRGAGTGPEPGWKRHRDPYFVELAVRHEEMHAEAFHYTRQTLGYPGLPEESRSGLWSGEGDLECARRRCSAWAPSRDDGFAFDNEKWSHPVVLEPFRIARRPVTNGEYRQFVAGASRLYWKDGRLRRFDRWIPIPRRRAGEARELARRARPTAPWPAGACRPRPNGSAPRSPGWTNVGHVWEWTCEHLPAVPRLRARPVQGILRALVRHAQGAARRELRHAAGRGRMHASATSTRPSARTSSPAFAPARCERPHLARQPEGQALGEARERCALPARARGAR